MPETLTEFINTTKTLTELLADVTIVANSGSERAVVRDVQISNPAGLPLRLKAGAMVLSTPTGNDSLSGSEIIGPSSSMTIDTIAAGILNRVYTVNSGGGVFCKLDIPTLFLGMFGGTGNTIVTSTTVTSFPGTATPGFICLPPSGHFYYADNTPSYPQLYKRASGANGAQTTLDANFGHIVCYDGARYIYGLTNGSSTAKICDTTTAAVTSVSVSWPNGSPQANYTHACAMDGYLWMRSSYNSTGTLVNMTTGAAQTLGGYASAAGQRFYVGMAKNTAGQYILYQTNPVTPTQHWFNIGSTLGAGLTVLVSGTTTISLSSSAGNVNQLYRLPGVDNYLVYMPTDTNDAFQLINMTTFAVELSLTPFGPTAAQIGYGKFLSLDTARAVTDAGTFRIRATGIKLT